MLPLVGATPRRGCGAASVQPLGYGGREPCEPRIRGCRGAGHASGRHPLGEYPDIAPPRPHGADGEGAADGIRDAAADAAVRMEVFL